MHTGRFALRLAMLASAGIIVAGAESRSLVDASRAENLPLVQELLNSGAPVNETAADGTTALHWLVRLEDPGIVARLLKSGADVNVADGNGVTPLYVAISLANPDLTNLLLNAGADPNAVHLSGENLLMLAAHVGEPGILRALLDHGADVNFVQAETGTTPLMLAVREGDPQITQILLDAGAEVNAATFPGEKPERLPPGFGGGSHGEGIVRGGVPPRGQQTPAIGGMTALFYAARDGNQKLVQMLLDAGADIDAAEANNITPLQAALGSGNFDVAAYLIERGADVNSADDYGRTPLWLATDYRNLDIARSGDEHNNLVDRERAMKLIRKLLAAGAKVNAQTTEYPPVRRYMRPLGDFSWVNIIGQTPFFRAALSGDIDLMRLLLDYGADPNIETEAGSTALMAAAGMNWVYQQTYTVSPEASLDAVKLCVKLGVDVNQTNSMGLAAVHAAANRGSDDIIQYLFDQGADLTLKDEIGRTPYVWAQGVFLATNGAIEKPTTMALIQQLLGESSGE